MKKIKLLNGSLATLVMVLLFVATGCKKDDNPILQPTAEFTYAADAGNPQMIVFTSTTENAVSFAWNFGDGESSTDENPTHTYAAAGDYTVTLTVTGAEGSTPAIASEAITVVEKPFEAITVENGDFELPGDTKHQNWTNVPGWNSDTEAADSGVEGDATNGWTAFKLTSDPAVYNLTDHTIADGEEFKVNMINWDIWNAAKFTITFYYDNGDGTRNVIESKEFDIVASQTNNLEFITTASAASVGSKIGIEFTNASLDGTDGWSGFDNVVLSVR